MQKKIEGDCPTIYGPKQSRRQGLSLGINLGDPENKCCTWSCVYCQCGFGSRCDYPSVRPARTDVIRRLVFALQEHPKLDSVTFAGNSEPTAYPEFFELVEEILTIRKRAGGKWVLNCLSNGSELEQEKVRRACDLLDEAWIKFDCGYDALLNKVNRPLARAGRVEDHVKRISLLREPRLQTLLWKDGQAKKEGRDLGNFTKENFEALLEGYKKIKPRFIHLTTIQRSTATPGLVPASLEELKAFALKIRAAGLSVSVFS